MTYDYTHIIIDSLNVLYNHSIADNSQYSAKAYLNVINELKKLNIAITTLDDIKNINGIGDTIKDVINEILETGSSSVLTQALPQPQPPQICDHSSLDAFRKIYGVGPVKAKKLVELGYTTIGQLRKNPNLLNNTQKIGLKYYDDLLERIPRIEMEEHQDILTHLITYEMEEKAYELLFVGSFRRNLPTSEKIDVLIRIPEKTPKEEIKTTMHEYVNTLKDFGYIEEIITLGDCKCTAICRMYNGKARHLDIQMTPDEEYAYAVMYFTGSHEFNVAFRQFAQNKGYTLNEHRLLAFKEGVKPVPRMKTEKDIFVFLGLRYIEPAFRINADNVIKLKSRPPIAPSSSEHSFNLNLK
jgi:DNA polymerase/3'-5' exonuclease PolX